MTTLAETTTSRRVNGAAVEATPEPVPAPPPTGAPAPPVPTDTPSPVPSERASAPAVRWDSLKVIRLLALLITGAVGVAAAVLSFSTLADLAERAGYPGDLSYLWPGIVDGTILLATMAIVVLGPHGDAQRQNRRFFWVVLTTAAVVSVGGNVVHALLPHGADLPVWLAIPIAAVAPCSLLADVHGATILGRLKAVPPRAAADVVAASTAPTIHDATAVLVKDRNPDVKAIAERSPQEIAEILRLVAAGESQRSIKRLTGIPHHRVINIVVKAAAEVRGERVEFDDDDQD